MPTRKLTEQEIAERKSQIKFNRDEIVVRAKYISSLEHEIQNGIYEISFEDLKNINEAAIKLAKEDKERFENANKKSS
jgi:hypothetical protein